MNGLGRVWKAITGGNDGRIPEHVPLSTIPRDIAAPKPVTFEVPRDPSEIVPSETRSAERFVPFQTATVLTTANGKRLAARIINVSMTGVAVESELAGFGPQDIAMVGSRAVMPGRRITLGMVFLFRKPLDAKLCGPDIIL